MPYLKDPQFKPAPDVLTERRERFAGLNDFVTAHGGWIISVPGDREVVVETLPGSNLPNVLADMGHNLKPEPDGERILATAINEKFAYRTDGTLGPMTEGSTAKPAAVVTHAGPCRVQRWRFSLP
jgi:hypothetical protein